MDGLSGARKLVMAITCLVTLPLSASAQWGCADDKSCTDPGQWLTAPKKATEGQILQTVPQAAPAPTPAISQPPVSQPLTQPQPQSFPQQPQQQLFQPGNNGGSLLDNGFEGMVADRGSIPGYIENAAPMNMFRMRSDSMFKNSFPDRAEFFYPQVALNGPGAGDTQLFNRVVNMFDFRGYLEFGDNQSWSLFTDVPLRLMRPDNAIGQTSGASTGLGDIIVGGKWAFIREQNTIGTFMLRGYLPTGEAIDGLGTDHYSIEPGFLFNHRFSQRAFMFGEVRNWIPIDGTNFAGDVLRYGIGGGYKVVDNCSYSMTPMAELVGWSVLDGLQTNRVTQIPESAETNIVNLKLGVRFNFGDQSGRDQSSLYVGWGTALSRDEWYQNIGRIDYSIFF